MVELTDFLRCQISAVSMKMACLCRRSTPVQIFGEKERVPSFPRSTEDEWNAVLCSRSLHHKGYNVVPVLYSSGVRLKVHWVFIIRLDGSTVSICNVLLSHACVLWAWYNTYAACMEKRSTFQAKTGRILAAEKTRHRTLVVCHMPPLFSQLNIACIENGKVGPTQLSKFEVNDQNNSFRYPRPST